MTAVAFHSKPNVPAAVAHLDHGLVTEVLAKHACNVTNASAELGVSSSDLRRLMWGNPQMHDAAFEVVEARLDKAEANIHEALHSDDARYRLAASMFTLRNSVRARRRGWLTSNSSVDVTINAPAAAPTYVFRWGNEKDDAAQDVDGDSIERDGQVLKMPRYGGDRSDAGADVVDHCIEGSVVEPIVLLERQDASAEESELAVAETKTESPPPDPKLAAAARYELDRIDAWIRARLTPWPPQSCWHCRRPFVVGDAWQETSNGEARARFHRACYIEWHGEREIEARRALNLCPVTPPIVSATRLRRRG